MKRKLDLSISTRKTPREDLLDQLSLEEIRGYSLTPINMIEREFQPIYAPPQIVSPSLAEIIAPIEKPLLTFAYIQSDAERIKKTTKILQSPEVIENLSSKAQEVSYILDYISISQNIIFENYYVFKDLYQNVVRYGINIHNTLRIVETYNDTLKGIIAAHTSAFEDTNKTALIENEWVKNIICC